MKKTRAMTETLNIVGRCFEVISLLEEMDDNERSVTINLIKNLYRKDGRTREWGERNE